MQTRPAIPLNIAALPKVDLHRHLEGSLRLKTLAEIARNEGLDLPSDEDQLQSLVQLQINDPRTADAFLAKFKVLRMFYCSPQIIRRLTVEAVEDAAADNVRYLEINFSPAALASVGHFPMAEVVDWVLEAAIEAAERQDIGLRLIAGVNRHEGIDLAEEVARIAVDHFDRGLAGLSLAGNEIDFPADDFEGVFRAVKQAGLHVTIHAGEWVGGNAVRKAIENFGADRIGHGVRVMEDPLAITLAKEKRMPFEVCLSSNLMSGVIESLDEHPITQMMAAGLQVTLNTDDPGILNTSLSNEYALFLTHSDFSIETIKGMILTAVQAAFIKSSEKKQLERELIEELF